MAAVARTQGIDPSEIEVWFADEARVGQKNKMTRRWARRGTRPRAPQDQRTASTYIFGGRHAVLLVDQAGWHLSDRLLVPANVTVVPLPAKCPELNPQENVWQFLRDNWLSNRVFTSYENIVDHCCHAWNKLLEQPWKIISIGSRDWAQQF